MVEIDTIIKKKWKQSGFKRPGFVDTIVIHATGGGNTLEWMRSSKNERAASYAKGIGLFHFLIQRDASIIQIIDPEFWVYHSHAGQADSRSIGIELEKYDPTNMIDINPKQMLALNALIYFLKSVYPITRIETHRYRARKYAGFPKWRCPMTLNVKELISQSCFNFDLVYPYKDDKLAWVLIKSSSKELDFDGHLDKTITPVQPLERDWHVSGNAMRVQDKNQNDNIIKQRVFNFNRENRSYHDYELKQKLLISIPCGGG